MVSSTDISGHVQHRRNFFFHGVRRNLSLPQAEIAGYEKHYDNNTNDVKNIVHISYSFLSRYRITVEPDARNITAREASLVLLSDEAQWHLKFSDIIRIGVLHPVYALKPLL